jgi:hypothetical protein
MPNPADRELLEQRYREFFVSEFCVCCGAGISAVEAWEESTDTPF